MADLFSILRPLLFSLDPETAHRMALASLRHGMVRGKTFHDNILKTQVFGLALDNPLGLAAGFDKDAEALAPLLSLGFGFVETGTITLHAQGGNPRPRVFRDIPNKSVINRMGFPGKGAAYAEKNLRDFRKHHRGIIGVNVGINKGCVTPAEDYGAIVARLSPLADYMVINISSPNTPGLRDLQERRQLENLLDVATAACPRQKPLLVKIAPDLDTEARRAIADTVMSRNVAGLVVSNTTISRPDALSPTLRHEKGGLSGALLRDMATSAIAEMYRLTEGRLPIIGVGGIASADDAYDKIAAGASLVQLYTALVFEGPCVVNRILEGLADRLHREGAKSVADIVGSGLSGLANCA